MKRNLTALLVTVALAAGASTLAAAEAYRYGEGESYRVARAPDWNVAATEGFCRLRVYVDDRARIQLRGDQLVVVTEKGHRSMDRGSMCNQPLPYGHVADFRVTTENARGSIVEVTPPDRRNDFTGALTIEDPQNGGDIYEVVVAWRNPPAAPIAVAPVELDRVAANPIPHYDELRACQDRVRSEFLTRNRDFDAYLEFTGPAAREDIGPARERIRGDAWARNRDESRPITYECELNHRTNRVLSATYELWTRSRVSASR